MLALMFFKNINSYLNSFPTKPSKGLQNELCLGNSTKENPECCKQLRDSSFALWRR